MISISFFVEVTKNFSWLFAAITTFVNNVPCAGSDYTAMLTCLCVIQVRYDLGGIYFQQGCTDQGAYGKAMEHFRLTRDLLQKVGEQNPYKHISILSSCFVLRFKWLQKCIRKTFV